MAVKKRKTSKKKGRTGSSSGFTIPSEALDNIQQQISNYQDSSKDVKSLLDTWSQVNNSYSEAWKKKTAKLISSSSL